MKVCLTFLLFSLLLNLILPQPYDFNGSYALIKNISSVVAISKNEDYDLNESKIAVGTKTGNVYIYFRSFENLPRITFQTGVAVTFLCWYSQSVLIVGSDLRIFVYSLQRGKVDFLAINSVLEMRCNSNPQGLPWLVLRYSSHLQLYSFENNEYFKLADNLQNSYTSGISFDFTNRYMFLYDKTRRYEYDLITKYLVSNITVNSAHQYDKVVTSKSFSHQFARFVFLKNAYIKFIQDQNCTDDEALNYTSFIKDIQLCENPSYLAVLQKGNSRDDLTILSLNYKHGRFQRVQSYEMSLDLSNSLVQTYEDKIIVVDTVGGAAYVFVEQPQQQNSNLLVVLFIVGGICVFLILLTFCLIWYFRRKKAKILNWINSRMNSQAESNYEKMQPDNPYAQTTDEGNLNNSSKINSNADSDAGKKGNKDNNLFYNNINGSEKLNQ